MKSSSIHSSVLFTLILFLVALIGCKNNDPVNPDPEPPDSVDTMDWNDPFADVPETPDIIMYEINERAFSASGDFYGRNINYHFQHDNLFFSGHRPRLTYFQTLQRQTHKRQMPNAATPSTFTKATVDKERQTFSISRNIRMFTHSKLTTL